MSKLKNVWVDEVLGTINVGDIPHDIDYNPGNGYMYVTNSGSDTISVIDENLV